MSWLTYYAGFPEKVPPEHKAFLKMIDQSEKRRPAYLAAPRTTALTRDRFVNDSKGSDRPFHPLEGLARLLKVNRTAAKPTFEDDHEGKSAEARGRWKRDGTSEHPYLPEL
jgi:hypothetical protein